MKKILWLLWPCSLLLLTALIGCSTSAANTTNAVTPKTTAIPMSTTTAVSSPTQPVPTAAGVQSIVLTPADLANRFYNAIEAQNYTLAYAYLDAKATNADGAVLTLRSFEQLAQDQNAQFGTITSFSAAWYTPMLVMTIMRKQIGAYHAHLQLRREGQAWKIVSLDRI